MTDDCKLEVWTDGTDTVVCHGRDDIAAAYNFSCGGDDYESDVGRFHRVDDDKPIRVRFDSDGDCELCSEPDADPTTCNGTKTLTAAQWVAKNGRGLLCSTEY